MAPQTMTDYERRRLENIRRNDEMIASLKLHHKATDLSSAIKRKKMEIKGYKTTSEKKPKTHFPVVVRRSTRAQQNPNNSPSHSDLPIRKRGFLSMQEASYVSSYDFNSQQFIDTIVGMSENAPLSLPAKRTGKEDSDYFNPGSLVLRQENVARLVPRAILSVAFFPSEERTVIVVGDELGHIGFWDADSEEAEGDGVYVYCPHSAPVSGISIHPCLLSKIFTAGYDGLICMMDVNKEMFKMVYFLGDAIFSLSQRPNDMNSLYFGEGQGKLKVWDERAGDISSSYILHARRINSIDFSSENNNLIATSSTDGTACIWDLRNINCRLSKCLKMVIHQRAVHSAYFSPSGSCLATTSVDKIGLLHGAGFGEVKMIDHNSQTNIRISSSRAIWGWDDSHLLVGSARRAVDVISTVDWTTSALESPYITAIPSCFASHPYRAGTLAGTTAGGEVYMWTPR